jgi:putative ABC transport system permease protein
MNLAVRDVRRHLPRFLGTAAGLGLLLTVVIAMQGIYAGMVDDATLLT